MENLDRKNVIRILWQLKRKEKCSKNAKAFLETVDTESFEVRDRLPWIQRTEEVLGKFC